MECPLRNLAGALMATGAESVIVRDIRKGLSGTKCTPECAWYDAAAEQCAILSLAQASRQQP